jgi:glycosyltransferase involved in cell wall biosynthesis
VFNIELAILAIIIKKIFFLKTIIFFRSINTLSQAYKFPESIWEKIFAPIAIRRILPYCDKIIAQSNGMKMDLIDHFKMDKNKIFTIFNPAINLAEIELLENEYENPKNNFLYVGRLRPQKGLVNLIKIFSRVKKENPDITLTLVGEGPEKEKLEELTHKLGISHSVRFMGYQPNPYLFFIRAKATVLTSEYEGFPNVLVESIATGTPVIAFDCPSGPADIIEPGVNGILVPNQDFDAFAEAMQLVTNDKIKFKKQEVINTSRKFSIDTIVGKYEELIKS